MTFTEAENAYLASQRLGRRPHRPRRQAPGHAAGLYYDPKPGTIDVTGFTMATSQKFRNAGSKARVCTITFGELLTHRAGFRLDSGLVFQTDDAAREQIRQGVQQRTSALADCNYINFTIFKDMLPLIGGGARAGASRARRSRGPLLPHLCSASGIRSSGCHGRQVRASRRCHAHVPRRPAPGPHGAGRPR